MRMRLTLGPTAGALALALAIAAGGCGGDGDSNEARAIGSQARTVDSEARTVDSEASAAGSQTFLEIVQGLRNAAESNETYRAARRARDLKETQRAVVKEFCNFVWQIKVNREQEKLGKLPYVEWRITHYAAYSRRTPFLDAVRAQMDKLQQVIDLASIDRTDLNPYVKACYV